MNPFADSSRGLDRTRVPAAVRAAAVVSAVVGLALLAASCGSSPSQVAQLGSTTTRSSPSSSASVTSAQQTAALAFARCMRSHGVPGWPDPNGSGSFDKSKLTPRQLGAGSSRVQAAQTACRHLLPNGGSGPNAAQMQQVRAQALQFSRCVRDHGVPNFPDPGSDGRIPDPASVGVDQGSPKFQAANDTCKKYRPPYMPSNSAYNAWARTHGGS